MCRPTRYDIIMKCNRAQYRGFVSMADTNPDFADRKTILANKIKSIFMSLVFRLHFIAVAKHAIYNFRLWNGYRCLLRRKLRDMFRMLRSNIWDSQRDMRRWAYRGLISFCPISSDGSVWSGARIWLRAISMPFFLRSRRRLFEGSRMRLSRLQ